VVQPDRHGAHRIALAGSAPCRGQLEGNTTLFRELVDLFGRVRRARAAKMAIRRRHDVVIASLQ